MGRISRRKYFGWHELSDRLRRYLLSSSDSSVVHGIFIIVKLTECVSTIQITSVAFRQYTLGHPECGSITQVNNYSSFYMACAQTSNIYFLPLSKTRIIHQCGSTLIFTGGHIYSIAFGISKCYNFEVWIGLCNLLEPLIACPAGLQRIHVL